MQIGDSHTAGDIFSGRLRDRFQDRFGNAGRGMLPPGVPHDYYSPGGVSASMDPAWDVASAFGRGSSGVFGLSGFRAETDTGGASMVLGLSDSLGADRFYLESVTGPGAGSVTLEADGRSVATISLTASTPSARTDQISLPQGTRTVRLTARGDGPVAILSWAMERDAPGVIYDALGIVGASATVLEKVEPRTLFDRFATRPIDALVVAYGTNEGFNDGLNVESYSARFTRLVQQIAGAAGAVPVLVVGSPDAARLPRSCTSGGADRDTFSCRGLTPAETTSYGSLFSSPTPNSAECVWHAPPKLEPVRRAQAQQALANNWFFWDWSAVMGTPCGMNSWATASTPLAWGDRVHLRPDGYRQSADRLYNELLSAYAIWRQQEGLSALAALPR